MTTFGSAPFDPARLDPADLDRMVADSERTLKGLREAMARLGEITGAAQSPDGLVSATVAQGGRLVELTLNPRAMRHDSRTLAESIVSAVQGAQDAAGRGSQELLETVLGRATPEAFNLDKLSERLDSAGAAFSRALDAHPLGRA
jgi:DNA-binding protein YbaB